MSLQAATVLLPRPELDGAERLRTRGPKIRSSAAVLRAAVVAGLPLLQSDAPSPNPQPKVHGDVGPSTNLTQECPLIRFVFDVISGDWYASSIT